MSDYDPTDDARKSYDAAIEAKRLRGDSHDWEGRPWKRMEQIGDCTLYLGDCLEILPALGKVDAVVTDPPYGIGESAQKVSNRQRRRGGASKALADQRDYGQDNWDQEPADRRVIGWLRENSDIQIIFGGNYFDLPPSSCWLVWDKENGDNDFADCELAWTNMPKAVRRINWMWNGMLRKGKEERFHLTQKPLGVMEWSLSHLPPTARLICDPYMGSGTTGVACVRRRLRFIGIEREPHHFATACKRIQDAYDRPDMFVEARAPEPRQEAMF